jgi:hypothetical protein
MQRGEKGFEMLIECRFCPLKTDDQEVFDKHLIAVHQLGIEDSCLKCGKQAQASYCQSCAEGRE